MLDYLEEGGKLALELYGVRMGDKEENTKICFILYMMENGVWSFLAFDVNVKGVFDLKGNWTTRNRDKLESNCQLEWKRQKN